jgi:hypothetical protein
VTSRTFQCWRRDRQITAEQAARAASNEATEWSGDCARFSRRVICWEGGKGGAKGGGRACVLSRLLTSRHFRGKGRVPPKVNPLYIHAQPPRRPLTLHWPHIGPVELHLPYLCWTGRDGSRAELAIHAMLYAIAGGTNSYPSRNNHDREMQNVVLRRMDEQPASRKPQAGRVGLKLGSFWLGIWWARYVAVS